MGSNSSIEWTDDTRNLWHGCVKIHEGCDHCYAETMSKRWDRDIWGNDKPRMEIKSVWGEFQKSQEYAELKGEIRRVFVGSMMDIFEKPMPLIDMKGNTLSYNTGDLRNRYFEEVVPRTPNLMHLMLTKRPSNINKFVPPSFLINPPANVMFGTSPATQATADTLIQQLLKVNGQRFLSIEPQLEHINIEEHLATGGIHWVIQGGESGHHKRPFNLDWACSLKEQCAKYSVPYFFKQIDKVQPIPDDLLIREFPLSSKQSTTLI